MHLGSGTQAVGIKTTLHNAKQTKETNEQHKTTEAVALGLNKQRKPTKTTANNVKQTKQCQTTPSKQSNAKQCQTNKANKQNNAFQRQRIKNAQIIVD